MSQNLQLRVWAVGSLRCGRSEVRWGLDFYAFGLTSRRMFVRFAKWFTVIALVLTLGGHWAILQTAAWVGMTVSYSSNASLSTALSKTFDGKHPCKLCKIVRAGKQAEKKSDQKFEAKKLDSFVASTLRFDFPPANHFQTSFLATHQLRAEVPLSPPPERA